MPGFWELLFGELGRAPGVARERIGNAWYDESGRSRLDQGVADMFPSSAANQADSEPGAIARLREWGARNGKRAEIERIIRRMEARRTEDRFRDDYIALGDPQRVGNYSMGDDPLVQELADSSAPAIESKPVGAEKPTKISVAPDDDWKRDAYEAIGMPVPGRSAAMDAPKPLPKLAADDLDYDIDPEYSDLDAGIAIGSLGDPGSVDRLRKKAKIIREAGGKPGSGSFSAAESSVTYNGQNIDDYNKRALSELDRSWAKRRIKELVSRGGVSGSKRDRDELKALIPLVAAQGQNEARVAAYEAQARGRARQAEIAGVVQAQKLQLEAQKESIKNYKAMFDDYVKVFLDAEEQDLALAAIEIKNTTSDPREAVKKLQRLKERFDERNSGAGTTGKKQDYSEAEKALFYYPDAE